MRRSILTSLLLWSSTASAASLSKDTEQPAAKHEAFKFPSTHELDLVFPRGAGQHLTFRPSYTFPAIFALQNTDFPISFRPYLEVQITKNGLKYAPYVPYNASSPPSTDSTNNKNLNHATTFVADLSSSAYHNWSSSSSFSSSSSSASSFQVQHLTFNLSSLIDLTVPGEYTLSWSFYAHNCSSSSTGQKWGTSPYNNTWVVDHYTPQGFEKETDYYKRFYGTKSATFTIATPDSAEEEKEALDPMNIKSWFDVNWCPWDNVILRATSQIKMSSPDPAYPYHDDDLSDVAPGGYNIKNLTKEEDWWDEENSYCTVLAPPELGATSSVEEEKTRKEVDKELRDGKPCRALLGQKEEAEKVMSQFLGGMTLEEVVGKDGAKDGEKSEAWRVGPPVGNGMGVVVAVMVTAVGGLLLI